MYSLDQKCLGNIDCKVEHIYYTIDNKLQNNENKIK